MENISWNIIPIIAIVILVGAGILIGKFIIKK